MQNLQIIVCKTSKKRPTYCRISLSGALFIWTEQVSAFQIFMAPLSTLWYFSFRRIFIIFSETRHIPIEIKPSVGIPKPFSEFLEPIRIEDVDKGINILRKISRLVFSKLLKALSEGIIRDRSNKLKPSNETLDEVRGPIFHFVIQNHFCSLCRGSVYFPIENRIYYDNSV